MMWVFGIVVVLIMGAVAVVAAGHGEGLGPAYDDRPDVLLPTDRPLAAQDLRRVRFTVGLRGYRAAEVDALLARLADELETYEDEREGERGSERDSGDEAAESPSD